MRNTKIGNYRPYFPKTLGAIDGNLKETLLQKFKLICATDNDNVNHYMKEISMDFQ